MSDYPRISTLIITATRVSTSNDINEGKREVEKPEKDLFNFDEAMTNVKGVFSAANDGLKMYKLVRDVFVIIIHEQAALSLEIDSFYNHIGQMLITKKEMLELLNLDQYYQKIKDTVDMNTPEFRQLDNDLIYHTNDFVDKLRRFIIGIDNIRNIGSYMHMELSPHSSLTKTWGIKNTLQKVETAAEMTSLILGIKSRTESLLVGIGDGIAKINSVRQDTMKVLRDMYRLVPYKNWAGRMNGLMIVFGLILLFLKTE